MQLKNESAWAEYKEKNQDDYGKAIIDYAERWGNLMEEKFNKGYSLNEVAEATSNDADLDGITGFMYGAAVQTLANVWIHGEALRKWHNIKIQMDKEGERANESGAVLNPALVTINIKGNKK